jgi:TPR repeat protein
MTAWKSALPHYQKAADAGHPDANYKVAVCHLWGMFSLDVDDRTAISYLLKACRLGATDAPSLLATCYYTGTGVECNLQRAFKLWSVDTNPYARYEVASLLTYGWSANGRWPAVSEKLAAGCIPEIEKLAEVGDARAYHTLADSYYRGFGRAKDEQMGLKMWIKASELGYVHSQLWVIYCYNVGKGCTPDSKESLRWLHLAAEQGYGRALCDLAGRYQYGVGGLDVADQQKATELYTKSWAKGYEDARNALERLGIKPPQLGDGTPGFGSLL